MEISGVNLKRSRISSVACFVSLRENNVVEKPMLTIDNMADPGETIRPLALLIVMTK